MIDFPLQERVLPTVLRRAAEAQPDWPFILHGDEVFSYADVDRLSTQLAHGLRKRGVSRGARVATILDNSPRYILTLFAVAKLGALNVPINTAARAELLRYYLQDADCTHVVVQDSYLPVLREAWPGIALPMVLVSLEQASDHNLPTWDDVLADGEALRGSSLDVALNAWDPWLILYTSGTTGPSKGSICPNAHSLSIGRTQAMRMALERSDRLYTCLPLFHGNALNYSTLTALWARATVALEARFSARRFWSDIHRYRATQFNAMMVVASILEKLPVTPEEQDNPVRIAALVPPPANRRQLEERWGLQIISQYALSEACPVAVLAAGEAYDKPRTSGRVSDNVELRIVDENDVEVPRGTPGEIVLRTRQPWTMFSGYCGKTEATLAAFRNLWFHTGDRAYLDADGYLFFVDRVKDAIRRRGENISAFEIETILKGHEAILEAAAVPVPSELGEDEVAVFIVKATPELTERAVIEYAVRKMAYFMVPRYVRFVDELPKTPSQKISKPALREIAKAGYREMWDREASGIQVNRFSADQLRPKGAKTT
ncbi:MAG: ATP-dependent acyl-CoA ligase [Betaproteobacteria bacterium]|nr:MAG: ATP-dependent acyl-CoA ligase [Betaproteobacteria bacterium]